MKLKGVLAVLFILFGFFKLSYSQSDTLFWFVAPQVGDGGGNFDRPILFRLTSLQNTTNVTIDLPADPSFVPIVFTVNANSTVTRDVTAFINQLENSPPNQVLKKGIRIRSEYPITIYYEVLSSFCKCNPEIFSLKGSRALGKEFYTPFQDTFKNGGMWSYSPAPFSAFDIVATENGTSVTITPTKNIVGRTANSPFTIVLDKGETYSATATSPLGSEHLGGSHIISTKPIAVTIKDDKIGFDVCADLAGDQLIPVDYIGTDYIITKGFLNIPDRIYVLAVDNNTDVFVNGVFKATINKGQQFVSRLSDSSAFVKTSKPAYLLHISGFGCEMGMAVLPPIACTGSSLIGFTRSDNEAFYLLLMVPRGGESNFTLNGSTTAVSASMFSNVPGTGGDWKFFSRQIPTSQIPSGVSSRISNSSHFFHMGIIHGTPGNGSRYAYFSDFNFSREMETKLASVCIGDSLKLKSTFLFDVNADEWKGPNGFSSKLAQPTLAFSDFNMSGKYYISSTSAGCSSFSDTIQVAVAPLPPPPSPLVANTPICIGDTLLIFAGTPNLLYQTVWTNANNDTLLTNPFNLLKTNVQLSDMGMYYAQFFNLATGCYSPKDSINISIGGPSLKPIILNTEDSLCQDQALVLKHNLALAPSDSLYWISPSSTFYTDSLVLPSVVPSDSGLYVLYYFQEGTCAPGLDSFWLRVFAYPSLESASILNNSPVCEGQELRLSVLPANPMYTYTWQGPASFEHVGSSFIRSNAQFSFAGKYNLSIANGPCLFKDTMETNFVVHSMPTADFIFSSPFAAVGVPFSFINKSTKASFYTWDFGDLTPPSAEENPSHTYLSEANRVVRLIAINDSLSCMDTIQKTFWVFNEEQILIPSSFSPNQDGLNEEFAFYITGVKEYRMEVYNRWGEKIFDSEIEKKLSWDGSYSGKPCQQDVYVVILYYTDRMNDRKMTKKTVQLLR
jgi:gliding motility-associated-like protein